MKWFIKVFSVVVVLFFLWFGGSFLFCDILKWHRQLIAKQDIKEKPYCVEAYFVPALYNTEDRIELRRRWGKFSSELIKEVISDCQPDSGRFIILTKRDAQLIIYKSESHCSKIDTLKFVFNETSFLK